MSAKHVHEYEKRSVVIKSRLTRALRSYAPITLLDLPNEILIKIFENLNYYDHKCLERTCKQINSIIKDDNVYFRYIQYRFPVHPKTYWINSPTIQPVPNMLHPYLFPLLFDPSANYHTGAWNIRLNFSEQVVINFILSGRSETAASGSVSERTREEFASRPATKQMHFVQIGKSSSPTLSVRRSNGVRVKDVLGLFTSWDAQMKMDNVASSIALTFA